MTRDEIHLVVLDLKSLDPLQGEVRAHLSPDEIERSKRLKVEGAAGRFVLIRGLLRRRLAEELGAAPGDLIFEYGESGKPRLGGAHRNSDLAFNLAHSGDLAAIAIARGRSVGVDIEKIRPIDNASLAERYFSAPEAIVFRVTPEDKWEDAFFHYWTAKESFLKAKGTGISEGLKKHSFSDPWEIPPRLTWTAGDPAEAGRWRFHRFHPQGGYIGTLAYEGDVAKVSEFDTL